MTIQFLGAAGTVTGSAYLLTHNDTSVILDFGMFQGSDELNALNRRGVNFDIQKVKGIVLTHAHLDHCGRLPILYKNNIRVPIYMTEATQELVQLSLLDSAHVASESKDGQAPLYTTDDVMDQFSYMSIVNYHKPFSVGPFSFEYYDAGHILGSASILVKVNGQTIVFSGDLGNTPQDLIQPTEYFKQADAVIMESTYGDSLHPKENPAELLIEEINAVEENGGTLLIPSFSLERAQELLHKIGHAKASKKVKADTQVFLDSPMAERATEIFKKFPQLYNRELATHATHSDPFDFPGLNVISKAAHSNGIKNLPGTKVIIAGSGMMNGGRILNHAITFLPLETTHLLFVGYQAEETIGRQILEGAREVDIYGEHVVISAHIAQTQAMSSHADQAQLVNWFNKIEGVKKLILTHGEEGPRSVLRSRILETHPTVEVFTPHLDDVIDL